MPVVGRYSDSVKKLLASINWLLVIVGCLLVGQTAHTLFLSQSLSNRALLSTLNSSPEPAGGMVRPLVSAGVGGARVDGGASPESSSPPSSILESRPSKAKRAPRVQSPNPDRFIDYDRGPVSEADRLGL